MTERSVQHVFTPEKREKIENKARSLLLEHGAQLPIDPQRIATAAGLIVAYRDLSAEDRYGYYDRETHTIFVHSLLEEQSANFVIAHELAHECLGHLDGNCSITNPDGSPEEFAAELFARALLMPKGYVKKVVRMYKEKDERKTAFSSLIEYVCHMFNVPEAKARVRLEECGFENYI